MRFMRFLLIYCVVALFSFIAGYEMGEKPFYPDVHLAISSDKHQLRPGDKAVRLCADVLVNHYLPICTCTAEWKR